jgi:hypothetical protein
MLLSTWIDKNGGTLKTGSLLGMKRNCVYAWRHGVALPRPMVMKTIVQKSGGKVTYGEMIDEYLTRRKKFSTAGKKKTVAAVKKNGKAKFVKNKKTTKTVGKKKKSVDAGF